MKLKPYLEYKDSGVPWLEKIPAHWDRVPMRAITKLRNKRGRPDLPLLSVYREYGVIRKDSRDDNYNRDGEDLSTYKVVEPGYLVLNKMKTWQGSLGVSSYQGIVSPAYIVCSLLENLNGKYVHYLLRSRDYITAYNQISYGVRVGQWDMRYDDLKQLPFYMPTRKEQDVIVAFLEMRLFQISRFIRNKRRLIELLKEQKQAIINQAVTHGIDPNVRLKPSGVEWLGDIPEHWEVRRLRTIASVKPSGVDKNSIENEQPVLLCNYVDVYKNEVITNKIDFMKATATQDEIRAFELKAGDVVITKDSESWDDIAVPAFVPETLPGVVCAYHLAIVRPNTKLIDGEFLFRAFSSDPVADQFRVSANGVTRYGLAQGAIKSAYFPFPPKEEQRKIIEFISEKSSEIHAAITRAEREIELMREYRTRLIADVVTGKVDVGDVPVEAFPQDWEEFEESAEPEEELEESLGAEEAEDADE